jgi:hypothetical protein
LPVPVASYVDIDVPISVEADVASLEDEILSRLVANDGCLVAEPDVDRTGPPNEIVDFARRDGVEVFVLGVPRA